MFKNFIKENNTLDNKLFFKRYLSFATVLFLFFGLGFYVLQADVVLQPKNGGLGNVQNVAKATCLTKTVDSGSDSIRVTYEIRSAGKNFYVEGSGPSLYAKDPNFDGKLIHPELKLSAQSTSFTTDRLTFVYYDKHNGARNSSSYFLDLNAEIVILKSGLIHTLSKDGKEYYPVDFSNINSKLPSCVEVPSSGTNPGTSPGGGGNCGTWGPTAAELGTCSDGIKNSNETGIDSGGRCAPAMLGGVGPGSNIAFFGHWPDPDRPVEISVDSNLSPVYAQFLPKAIRDWNQAVPILVTEGGSNAIHVSIENCDFGATDWVGVTAVNLNGNKIISAPVYINDHWMKTSSYNTPVHQEFVVKHELGHAFGLDHQDVEFCNPNTGSVMDYTAFILGGTHTCDGQSVNFGISNEHPNPNDIEALRQAYQNLP